MRHAWPLQQLRSLDIRNVFAEVWREHELLLYRPPNSPVFPQQQFFAYRRGDGTTVRYGEPL